MRDKRYVNILVIGLIILLAGASVLPSLNAKDMAGVNKGSLVKPVGPLFEGNSYFILLDDYTDGAGQANHWTTQLRFDSINNVVESEYDGIQLPLILDEWVEIRLEIDLDGDWHEVYYNGTFYYDKEWTAGINNDYQGELVIDAVDLFANGATSVYYDDISLEEVGVGVVWSENFDSYADGSSMHGQGGWKGWDNDPAWTAYVSSTMSRSSPHSVDIKGDADLVYEYSDITSGEYVYTAWMFIPSDTGDPPGAPDITGTTQGDAGTEYDYVFNAVDPDGDDVRYHIDWGDENTEVTDFASSGTDVTVPHTYTTSGTFTIIAYAEDSNGNTGPEGTLEVTMPRNKAINRPTLNWLQCHPYLFPLLQKLLQQLQFGFGLQ